MTQMYISSTKKINDDKWHTIKIKRTNQLGLKQQKKLIELLIDDSPQDHGTIQRPNNSISTASVIYLGNAPIKTYRTGFQGTMKKFLINGKPVIDIIIHGSVYPVNNGY